MLEYYINIKVDTIPINDKSIYDLSLKLNILLYDECLSSTNITVKDWEIEKFVNIFINNIKNDISDMYCSKNIILQYSSIKQSFLITTSDFSHTCEYYLQEKQKQYFINELDKLHEYLPYVNNEHVNNTINHDYDSE